MNANVPLESFVQTRQALLRCQIERDEYLLDREELLTVLFQPVEIRDAVAKGLLGKGDEQPQKTDSPRA